MAVALSCALLALAVAGFFAYQARVAEGAPFAEQQQHQEEKRQAALERALLAAFTGDFNEADKAILEAEQLGASTGQVRLLRGQVAYYRGQEIGAIH